MNNIVENNRLIAEFMGLSYCTKYMYEGWYKNHEHNHRICDYDGLKYHSDWNWLMKVVQAIEEKGYVVAIKGISCAIYPLLKDNHEEYISSYVCGDLSKKIDIVYSAIIGFIIWYNIQLKCDKIDSGEIDTDEEKSTFASYISEKHNIDFFEVTSFTDEHYENLLSTKENEDNFLKWYNQQSK